MPWIMWFIGIFCLKDYLVTYFKIMFLHVKNFNAPSTQLTVKNVNRTILSICEPVSALFTAVIFLVTFNTASRKTIEVQNRLVVKTLWLKYWQIDVLTVTTPFSEILVQFKLLVDFHSRTFTEFNFFRWANFTSLHQKSIPLAAALLCKLFYPSIFLCCLPRGG